MVASMQLFPALGKNPALQKNSKLEVLVFLEWLRTKVQQK
jgi:hypothetical protein